MDTNCVCILDVYDNLLDIRRSYVRRAKFLTHEMYTLKLAHSNYVIHDNAYFKRLCPLNLEKTNINNDYKNRVHHYVSTIPSMYMFQDMIDEFTKDLL